MGEIAAGFAAALALTIFCGGPMIVWLQRVGAKQTVSSDAPSSHSAKQNTTTMGGLIILLGLFAPMLVLSFMGVGQSKALILLGLTAAFAGIGFIDDILIARRGKNLGLKARQKLALQFLCGAVFVGWTYSQSMAGRTTLLTLGDIQVVDLGIYYYPFTLLLIVGMSNAVNLTDGLDGLAAGVSGLISLALASCCFAMGSLGWLHIFGSVLAGACAGFLWYNCNPAQIFMGDTGSLALGAALAGLAILGKVELPLLLFAVVPIVETVSVILQVSVFRLRKRAKGLEYAREHRLFRRTPLHHHFEEFGWHEVQVVVRFWMVALIAATIGVLFMGDSR